LKQDDAAGENRPRLLFSMGKSSQFGSAGPPSKDQISPQRPRRILTRPRFARPQPKWWKALALRVR